MIVPIRARESFICVLSAIKGPDIRSVALRASIPPRWFQQDYAALNLVTQPGLPRWATKWKNLRPQAPVVNHTKQGSPTIGRVIRSALRRHALMSFALRKARKPSVLPEGFREVRYLGRSPLER